MLYQGLGPWTSTHGPFETAPIHLHQLLAPRLDQMGASENHGSGCATTLLSRNRPPPPHDVTYTYPGNGATGWPAAQTAGEGPYANTQTGPYLYVMFDGADLTPFDTATETGVTLTGPDGAVVVYIVDDHTPGIGIYLPTGILVIPRAPLKAQATYTASVTASVTSRGGAGPVRAFSHSWSFTTGGLAPPPPPPPPPPPSPPPPPPPPPPVHVYRIGLKASEKRISGGRTRVSFKGQLYFGSTPVANACTGKVKITIYHRLTKVATKTVGVNGNRCTFGQSVTISSAKLKNDGGRVYARFTGNNLVFPASSGAAVF